VLRPARVEIDSAVLRTGGSAYGVSSVEPELRRVRPTTIVSGSVGGVPIWATRAREPALNRYWPRLKTSDTWVEPCGFKGAVSATRMSRPRKICSVRELLAWLVTVNRTGPAPNLAGDATTREFVISTETLSGLGGLTRDAAVPPELPQPVRATALATRPTAGQRRTGHATPAASGR
jgi:hypothetical protein